VRFASGGSGTRFFCTLNDIERKLAEALNLLVQAAASMRRFGDSHSALDDGTQISAFLRDAILYYRSEAEVPRRVEAHLGDLERIADEFRSLSLEPVSSSISPPDIEADDQTHELRRACEDLQVDIAVLLESALMAGQQALAEYTKMHCRIELLATEYEPLCRLELEAPSPAFLPLLGSDTTAEVVSAALPELAVQWAMDFSKLVGTSSQGLEGLVRELEHRRRQVRSCAGELRANVLRRAALGHVQVDGS